MKFTSSCLAHACRLWLAALCAVCAVCAAGPPRAAALCAPPSTAAAAAGAQSAADEKRSRTPAQKKLDSQLLYAIYERRGERERKGTPKSSVEVDERGRVYVDIRARVSKALLARVRRLGGEVVSYSEQYNSILARVPVLRLEALAGRADLVFISPAPESTTN